MYILKYLSYLFIVEIIISILSVAGILVLLKYLSKGIVLLFAIVLTPFYALFQLATGKASNTKLAVIIAVSGMIVFLVGIFFACIV